MMQVNTIICGDCLEVMKDWPDNCVDLVVTSPPYGDLRSYEGYVFDFKGIAQQFYKITKKGGVVVWIVGDMTVNGSETGDSFKQALYFKQIGFNLHDTMIYGKAGFSMPANNRYHQVFEYMFILSKGPPAIFNPLTDRQNFWRKSWGASTIRQKDGTLAPAPHDSRGEYGMRFNVWYYSTGGFHQSATDNIAHEHPAIFPEQLAADHIKTWSNKGDLVFDPMNGSGTTTRMANLLGRRYIGIDISEKYCQIARQRLEAVDTGVPVKEQRSGQLALFRENPK